jgi:hypothetical protein
MKRGTWHSLGTIGITFALVAALLMGLSGTAIAITNGQPDNSGHPYVGLAVFDVAGQPAWSATGVLISPRVFLTAGHATDGADAARVWFASDVTGNPDFPLGGASSIEASAIFTHPDFCIGCAQGLPGFDTHDVGVLILSEPVDMPEYGLLPAQGLVDALAMKTDVDLVGYGVQYQEKGGGVRPGEAWTGPWARYCALADLVASSHVNSNEFIKVTANPGQGKGGAAFGDSGGPVLLGGTRVILAVNSYVKDPNCSGVTYANRIDTTGILKWIDLQRLSHDAFAQDLDHRGSGACSSLCRSAGSRLSPGRSDCRRLASVV